MNNFFKNDCTFPQNAYLTIPISSKRKGYPLNMSLDYFDKDGYELTLCEGLIHMISGITLNEEIQNHKSLSSKWYYQKEEQQGITIDHSMILTRMAYGGELRKQIEIESKKRPHLIKLLSIRPKFGIDISIDYVSKDAFIEVLHIEQDFRNRSEAVEAKEYVESKVNHIDFEDAAKYFINNMSKWERLNSDDQSDWKAQNLGFSRAFNNKKVNQIW